MRFFYRHRIVLLVFCVTLVSCSSTEKREEKKIYIRGQTTPEDLSNVVGFDSSVRETTHFRRLISDYRYNIEDLSRRAQALEASRNLDARIEYYSIKRMLGQKTEALRGLQSLLNENPDHMLIMKTLANVYLDLRKYEKARLVLLKALEKSKGDAALHNNMGFLFFQLNEIPDAIAAWKRAIKLSPNHLDARLNLGALALQNHHYSESHRYCNDVLKVAPRDPDATLCECVSFMGLGRFDEADSCYQSAEREFQNWDDLQWNRAFLIYRKGNLQEAKSRIEKLLVRRGQAVQPDSAIFKFLQQVKMEIRAQDLEKQQSQPAPTPAPEGQQVPPDSGGKPPGK